MANYLIRHAHVMNPSLKIQKDKAWRASGMVNMWRLKERGPLREITEPLGPFPLPCPMHLFHLTVPKWCPSIINWQSSN